jgi:hypothetical protein
MAGRNSMETEAVIAKFGCPREVAGELAALCEERIDLLEAQLGFIRNAQRVWASDASQPALDRVLAHLLELTFDAVSATIDVLDELGPLAEMGDHADLEQDVVMARLRAAIEAAKQRLAATDAAPEELADTAETRRYGDGDGDDTQISSTD